jgi:uncharacterized membrane protein
MLSACVLAVTVASLGISDAEMKTLSKGDVPTRAETFTNAQGKSVGRGWGAIVIDRSIGEVWKTMARMDDRAEYAPRLKSLKVLERQGDRWRVLQDIDATITTAHYTAWYRVDDAEHTIHWTLDRAAPDNTLKDIEGDYLVAELAPGRTILVYRTYVDSGLHVPQMIQKYMTRKSIPELLRAIKKRVESGGTWRK